MHEREEKVQTPLQDTNEINDSAHVMRENAGRIRTIFYLKKLGFYAILIINLYALLYLFQKYY